MKFIRFAGFLGVVWLCAGAPAHAQLAPLQQTAAPTASDLLACDAAKAEVIGRYDDALALAEKSLKKDERNPWATYDRADALQSLRKPDQAVTAFQEAERRYSPAEIWGKSIAIWGQANALSQAGRCEEASPIFERYATIVEAVDKAAADLGRLYAKRCTPRPAAH